MRLRPRRGAVLRSEPVAAAKDEECRVHDPSMLPPGYLACHAYRRPQRDADLSLLFNLGRLDWLLGLILSGVSS